MRVLSLLALAVAALGANPQSPSSISSPSSSEECGCCFDYYNEVDIFVHSVSGDNSMRGGASCAGDVMVSCSSGAGCHTDEYVMACLFPNPGHSHSGGKNCDPPVGIQAVDLLSLDPESAALAQQDAERWGGTVSLSSDSSYVTVHGCGGSVLSMFPNS
jgi:hypothetical protein